MTGGSHIVAIGADADASEGQEEHAEGVRDALTLEDEWAEEEYFEDESYATVGSWKDWIVPAIAVLALAAWTGAFAFANWSEMIAGATVGQWTSWISQWAMPAGLIVVVWLLAMRSSRREQARFADTSRLLSQESAGLEAKLKVVNRELSLARDFIASQARDLESLGRVASERLSENATTLSELVEQNGQRIDSIASVSDTARENMEKLRNDLPVISNSARDVTNQIGNAGRTAKGQIDQLSDGFKRLNEFGGASEHQVKAIHKKVTYALSQFKAQTDHLGTLADRRFAALAEQSKAFRTELDGHEVEALAAMKRRGEALTQEIDELRGQVAGQEDAALAALKGRLEALQEESGAASRSIRDGENEAADAWRASIAAVEKDMGEALERINRTDQEAVARSTEHLAQVEEHADKVEALLQANSTQIEEALIARTQSIDEQMSKLDASFEERRAVMEASEASLRAMEETISARMDEFAAKGQDLAELGDRTSNDLSQAVEQLRNQFEQGREALEGTDVMIAGLTDASVRLLELIQASAQHSEEILPSAIHNAQTSIQHLQSQTGELANVVEAAEQKASTAAAQVSQAKESAQASVAEFATIENARAEQLEKSGLQIATLRSQLDDLDQRGGDVTQRLHEELQPAVESLQHALAKAMDSVQADSASQIARITAQAGKDSAATIESAIKAKTAAAIADLEAAAKGASAKSREATKQMRDQLGMVADLTSNLESRIAHARTLAQEQVDNDFARRVALITESLNSHAIDLSRAMSTDVTDTAWASYLKGDRGIFTRRAVSLLDKEETREIYDIYESDPDFREHVSRYIHDFEAMLRTLLSTRDGKAISVTLLSSDMGKLYVALAQAIERLRT